MNPVYVFRPIRREEISEMFGLILERMAWMEEKGIHQWNKTEYDKRYPLAYYEEKQEKGELFILEAENGCIAAGAVLLEEDPRWKDAAPSIYVHNFLSRIGCRGAGEELLHQAEGYALRLGKQYLRLDSSRGNENLAVYYSRMGFTEAGTCREGAYEGILRQKKL